MGVFICVFRLWGGKGWLGLGVLLGFGGVIGSFCGLVVFVGLWKVFFIFWDWWV